MALEHYTTKFALASALLLAFGCPADDSGDTDAATDATGTGATSSPTTGNTMSTTNMTSAGTTETTSAGTATTDGGETTAAPETGSTSVSADSSGSAGDSSTGAVVGTCDPSPDDTGCLTCIKTSCCAELEACLADVDCKCIHDCVEAGFPNVNPGQCAGDCPGANLDDPSSPEGQFDACAGGACFLTGMCP